jgi:ectoine hydroxylase-related dioxygenase (phytanoyl-CoA dioxygenase family)
MMQELSTRAGVPERWPAPEAAPHTPHHLTSEQIRFFDDNGYLVLHGWIPPELLSRLRDAGDAWIQDGWKQEGAEDFKFRKIDGVRTMFRVDYVHDKRQPASLELLGSPQVLAVAESLCGPNFVPTYESMVFKSEGKGVAIEWHQDACHPGNYRIFNLDVYLDASEVGSGALKVVPGSSKRRQDICAVAADYGWEPPGVIDVPMQPGDVLVHDVMVVHGSEATDGKALRRTIYYEFRAAEEILEDGPWDRSWIDQRLRLVPLALRRHAERFPTADQFSWNVAPAFKPDVGNDEDAELRVVHTAHMAGAYCSAGDAPGRQKELS